LEVRTWMTQINAQENNQRNQREKKEEAAADDAGKRRFTLIENYRKK